MSSDAAGRITSAVEDGIATVTIDDPRRRNALTKAMCVQLAALMPHLDHDPSVVAIVLRGAGDAFCAGAAIDEITDILREEQADGTHVDRLSRADQAITAVAKPTVALVDGPCMGGGWQLAAACDFVVASERSVFALTPAKLGLLYPRLGVERLVRQVGPAAAKYLLLTGDAVTARRALELGLVTEVVADDGFAQRSAQLTAGFRDLSRFTMHALARLIDLTISDDSDLDAAWEAAWQLMADGPDLDIGVRAFLAHERPRFAWRP